jgi:hypothetical protein
MPMRPLVRSRLDPTSRESTIEEHPRARNLHRSLAQVIIIILTDGTAQGIWMGNELFATVCILDRNEINLSPALFACGWASLVAVRAGGLRF